MASAALIGVNPVIGLYSSIVGPIVGGLFASTRLMVVATTTAAALAAASALEGVDDADRAKALFLLTIIAGFLMIVAGILRLGRYTRFVSHSVMTGFLTGVAIGIILGQLADFTGADVSGPTGVAKAFDLLTHLSRIDLPSLAVGASTLAILFGLARTRWAKLSALVALLVPTVAIALLDAGSVAQVEDSSDIPRSVPLPSFPDLSLLSFELITGAAAVAVIALVQGAGVSESAANPDGSPSDANKDFTAQGAANIAVGIFRGQPVGGSVGSTALNVAMGARTRWAAILSGALLLPIVVLLSGFVGRVPMPVLAAVLIYAAIGALRPGGIATIWRTGQTSQLALAATFVATLFLPVAAAVGIGVVLSLLLQLNQDAMDLKVVQLTQRADGKLVESPAPRDLPSNEVTLLDVYGSLLYAGSRTLRARLPAATAAHHTVVVLRLRGRTELGATFFRVISAYSRELQQVDGRLYLSGLDGELFDQLRRVGGVDLSGPVRAFPATEVVGESTGEALAVADAWLVQHDPQPPDGSDEP